MNEGGGAFNLRPNRTIPVKLSGSLSEHIPKQLQRFCCREHPCSYDTRSVGARPFIWGDLVFCYHSDAGNLSMSQAWKSRYSSTEWPASVVLLDSPGSVRRGLRRIGGLSVRSWGLTLQLAASVQSDRAAPYFRWTSHHLRFHPKLKVFTVQRTRSLCYSLFTELWCCVRVAVCVCNHAHWIASSWPLTQFTAGRSLIRGNRLRGENDSYKTRWVSQ